MSGPPDRDAAVAVDIHNHGARIGRFLHEISLEAFLANDEKQAAVLHHLMIIGEAARRFSDAFKSQLPAIPWREVVAMRNLLIQ